MADLRDREVAVSDKNDDRMGPSGRRARSKDSLYLEVGGSKDVYNVTINFDSTQGHWCEKFSGDRCHGNGNGKSRTYGKPSERNKRNPQHWCKHVQAAMSATDMLAEAQERTAIAFGAPRTARLVEAPRAVVAPVVVEAPRAVVAPVVVEAPHASARERLAALDAERERLVAEVAADEKAAELRTAIAELINVHGKVSIAEALNEAAA